MNNRIHQLHEEAMKSCDEHRSDTLNYHRIYREKFAELIVKECASVCESATQEGQPLHLVSIGYADRIKQHFGVEE